MLSHNPNFTNYIDNIRNLVCYIIVNQDSPALKKQLTNIFKDYARAKFFATPEGIDHCADIMMDNLMAAAKSDIDNALLDTESTDLIALNLDSNVIVNLDLIRLSLLSFQTAMTSWLNQSMVYQILTEVDNTLHANPANRKDLDCQSMTQTLLQVMNQNEYKDSNEELKTIIHDNVVEAINTYLANLNEAEMKALRSHFEKNLESDLDIAVAYTQKLLRVAKKNSASAIIYLEQVINIIRHDVVLQAIDEFINKQKTKKSLANISLFNPKATVVANVTGSQKTIEKPVTTPSQRHAFDSMTSMANIHRDKMLPNPNDLKRTNNNTNEEVKGRRNSR